MSGDNISKRKAELRRSAASVRLAAHTSGGADAAAALARHGMEVLAERRFTSVAGYWPIRSEIDVRPLMAALAESGRDVLLPVVVQVGHKLVFRRWHPGMELEPGPFGTVHPSAACPTIDPDVVLVPMLAFDGQHRRLGYGAGHFDVTLGGLRARKHLLAIGVGYAAQRVDEVPTDGGDEPVDLVLTEHGIV
jgi:5-formyltetrahydrofolate cyclo-ligase